MYLEAAREAEEEAEPGIVAHLPAWFCNHCSGPEDGDSATRDDVLLHLAIECVLYLPSFKSNIQTNKLCRHGKPAARQGADYIFNEVYRAKLEEPRSIEVIYERVPVDL